MRTRLFISLSALGLLAAASGCSTQQTANATPAAQDANTDEPLRFWAGDSVGAACFNRDRVKYTLVARARTRDHSNEAVANVPTSAR